MKFRFLMNNNKNTSARRSSCSRKGFTLAELLIVVAIIGVLVVISIPIFSSQLTKAKQATDKANVRSAKAAAAAEYMTDGETGPVTYIYENGKAVKLSDTSTDSFIDGKGYGKSDEKDNEQLETGASGTPKDGYVEVTIDGANSDQIKAKWISSAGAHTAATGIYTFSGNITRDSIGNKLSELNINPDDVTTFKAASGSTIKETVKGDGNGSRDRDGVLVDTFKQFKNLKTIDLSEATLTTGNINLFRDIPDSVQEIKLPNASSEYDIRGKWYYAGGEEVAAPRDDSGAVQAEDSRITTGHNGATIYRSQEEARKAGAATTQQTAGR